MKAGRRAGFLAVLGLGGLALPYVARLPFAAGGTLAWLLDLASHWQWLFLALLLGAGAVAAFRDRRWALCLLAAPLPWLSAAAALSPGAPGAPALGVASANVHFENRDVSPLRQWLARENPDIVVLLEVSPEYAAGLAALSGYPFRTVAAEDGPFGIALLSRLPLLESAVRRDAEGIARIEARLQWGGRQIGIVALHPMPPLSPEYGAARDGRIVELAEAGNASGLPSLIAGDFNATPWSSTFFRAEGLGWRRATGLAPTWPAVLGGEIGIFGIPIDHVLASPEWALQGSALGPSLGSDHLPVVARLSLADAASRRE